MSALKSVRNLKMFNRLNKSIKQGITDLQNKDPESANNYLTLALRTAQNLEKVAEEPYRENFSNIIKGIQNYQQSKDEDMLVSTKPYSVHTQLWTVHRKICDDFGIPYVEDVDEMDRIISDLASKGDIS